MELPPPTGFTPVTFYLNLVSDASTGAPPCSAQVANIDGFDYINGQPGFIPGPPATPGTFMQRLESDAWKALIAADYSGVNPYRGIDDEVTAACSEWTGKFTRTVYENSGKPSIHATIYLIRKQVN